MPNPYAGWKTIWAPDGTYGYIYDPSGKMVYRWFQNDAHGASNIDFQSFLNTANLIQSGEQYAGPDYGGGGGTQGGGGGATPGGTSGGGMSWEEFMTKYGQFYQSKWDAEAAYSKYQEDLWNSRDAEAEAEQAAADAKYEAERLATWQANQQESWPGLVQSARNIGEQNLSAQMPSYMPPSVANSLFGYGQKLGTSFGPAWPGGTGYGEAQMGPTPQDFINYIIGKGFPGYIL